VAASWRRILAGHVASTYGILFLRHEGKRTHVGLIRRSYGVKIYLKIRWEGVDWILLALDRDLWGAVINTVVPSCSMNCSGFLELVTKY
jgi:hypothetical protein